MSLTRRIAVAALLVVVVSSAGHSQQPKRVMAYGQGADSCGRWTDNRKTSSASYGAQSWVLGWVSAVNSYAKVPLQQTDAQAMAAWIDNYCAAQPLKHVAEAADALADELGAKW